jgi:hypothetical protein
MTSQNKILRFTSRTAALTYQTCRRKRFLSNHWGFTGLTPEAIDLNLETGNAVHRGLQHLFEHCRLEHPDGSFEEKCINEAVKVAVELFRTDASKHSIALRTGEDMFLSFVIAEHECLIEGLIRCFAIKRLPSLLAEYEIVEVEMDENFIEFSPIVIWQSKADAAFLTKDYSKGIVVCSIKTANEYADVTLRNIITDMQGNSEWAAIQARLDREFAEFNKAAMENALDKLENKRWHKYFNWCNANNQKPKVYAVQYEHLITGEYRDYEKMGLRKRQTFLLHPYKLELMGGINAFTGAKSFPPTAYKWKWGQGRQPKGWNKIDIWEDVGIKNWVDMLASGQVQREEGDPLDLLIRTSDLIIRTDDKLEEWLISTRYQEESIVIDLEILEAHADWAKKNDNWGPYNIALMKLFPKDTQQCWDYYGRDCQFTKLCHEGCNLNELMDAGFYIPRVPHHDGEKLHFIERKLIKDE